MEIERVAGKLSVVADDKNIHIEGAQTRQRETGELYDIFRVDDFGIVINRTKIINHFQLPDLVILSLEEGRSLLDYFGEPRNFCGRVFHFFDGKKSLCYSIIVLSFYDIVLDILPPGQRQDAARLRREVIRTVSHEGRAHNPSEG